MFLLLVLLFVVAPVAELYLIVQVAGGIGIPETIVLFVVISFVGAWLAKWSGIAVLRRLQVTLGRGEMPSTEIVDGALVLLVGALLIAPGFISDVLAILLLLPPSRAAVRAVVLRRIRAGGGFATLVGRVPGTTQGSADVWDVEGWEDPPERPGLSR